MASPTSESLLWLLPLLSLHRFASALVLTGHGPTHEQGRAPCPATIGPSYRWPRKNPALVAPLALRYDNQTYRHPLKAEYLGKSISIPTPADFKPWFEFIDEENITAERYRLHSIEIRRAGTPVEGVEQAMMHTLEAALMYEGVEGTTNWASIVVPFSVSSDPVDPKGDILTALFAGDQDIPKRVGQVRPVMMSQSQTLDLGEIYHKALFQAFWTDLPTACPGDPTNAEPGPTVHTRLLLRAEPLQTLPGTVNQLLDALVNTDSLPMTPPRVTWLLGTCPGTGEDCPRLRPRDLHPELLIAQDAQIQNVIDVRRRKKILDQRLAILGNATANHTKLAQQQPPANWSIVQAAALQVSKAFENATLARKDLHDAQENFEQSTAFIAQLKDHMLIAKWHHQWRSESPGLAPDRSESDGEGEGGGHQVVGAVPRSSFITKPERVAFLQQGERGGSKHSDGRRIKTAAQQLKRLRDLRRRRAKRLSKVPA